MPEGLRRVIDHLAALIMDLGQGEQQVGLRIVDSNLVQTNAGSFGVVVIQPDQGQVAQRLLGTRRQLAADTQTGPPIVEKVHRSPLADRNTPAADHKDGDEDPGEPATVDTAHGGPHGSKGEPRGTIADGNGRSRVEVRGGKVGEKGRLAAVRRTAQTREPRLLTFRLSGSYVRGLHPGLLYAAPLGLVFDRTISTVQAPPASPKGAAYNRPGCKPRTQDPDNLKINNSTV